MRPLSHFQCRGQVALTLRFQTKTYVLVLRTEGPNFYFWRFRTWTKRNLWFKTTKYLSLEKGNTVKRVRADKGASGKETRADWNWIPVSRAVLMGKKSRTLPKGWKVCGPENSWLVIPTPSPSLVHRPVKYRFWPGGVVRGPARSVDKGEGGVRRFPWVLEKTVKILCQIRSFKGSPEWGESCSLRTAYLNLTLGQTCRIKKMIDWWWRSRRALVLKRGCVGNILEHFTTNLMWSSKNPRTQSPWWLYSFFNICW